MAQSGSGMERRTSWLHTNNRRSFPVSLSPCPPPRAGSTPGSPQRVQPREPGLGVRLQPHSVEILQESELALRPQFALSPAFCSQSWRAAPGAEGDMCWVSVGPLLPPLPCTDPLPCSSLLTGTEGEHEGSWGGRISPGVHVIGPGALSGLPWEDTGFQVLFLRRKESIMKDARIWCV